MQTDPSAALALQVPKVVQKVLMKDALIARPNDCHEHQTRFHCDVLLPVIRSANIIAGTLFQIGKRCQVSGVYGGDSAGIFNNPVGRCV